MGVTLADVEANPERYRLLKGGAIYDYELGRIAGHTGNGPYQITAENGAQLRQRRAEMVRDAFAEGFIAGTPGANGNTGDAEAMFAAGKKTAQLLHAADNPRGFAELLNAAAKWLDVEEKSHALSNAGASPQLIDALTRLVRQTQQAQTPQVIDVEPVDNL